ncbi:MAG: UDP-N-acetylenolpyruvoylglucosamine reductase [Candidatus Vogelbacteria bacterium RIFOXYD2_FULL_44_9]|uniref:UDP-N-acetylenolpyruvoylglucosamine reductase n=1 Tax=Candidatus Vogelbacteria bacterium RIFOXYD2_FULL_44_9 TaxID=1802441 RepID=A0A1G2QMD1_9BACT|nr:MAG: UDP-N-acetylenolpyruvoylglucosamine reductase [Candidatus Vogelbacteria bacterium RIFOXYD2_FULL_44_9]
MAKKSQFNWPGLRHGEKLSQHTYFALGGPAQYFLSVARSQDLLPVLAEAQKNKIPTLVLGGGSNVAMADKGWSGLVIKFENKKPTKKDCLLKNGEVVCEASVPLAYLINFSIKQSLAGLEKMSGIPGGVGGAIIGNAGAYGTSISDQLVWVEIFDGHKVRRLTKAECRFGYRDSIFKHQSWLVLKACFNLIDGNRATLKLASKKIIKIRDSKYPAGLLCPGSFFKNIPVEKIAKKILAKIDQTKVIEGKLPVAVLLDAVGAKGERVGGVAVSDFHSNFIINTGRGKQAEVKKLAAKLKAKVRKKFDIELVEEVRYIG